jgi:hypothetical protein
METSVAEQRMTFVEDFESGQWSMIAPRGGPGAMSTQSTNVRFSPK